MVAQIGLQRGPPAGDSFGVLRMRGARGGEVKVTAELGGVEVVALVRCEEIEDGPGHPTATARDSAAVRGS